jgi:hypothetical protein
VLAEQGGTGTFRAEVPFRLIGDEPTNGRCDRFTLDGVADRGNSDGSNVPKVDISKSTRRSASRSSATKNWGIAFIFDRALVI